MGMMEPVIKPVDRYLLKKELTKDRFIRETRKGGNLLFEVTAAEAPNVMREIGRLREISFRLAGGGTGKSVDIDVFDTDPEAPYRQLIVWDPHDEEIVGGYRYIKCGGLDVRKMATSELYSFSEQFKSDFLPFTIELGRSFVQPNYQSTNIRRKSIFALDNLWDGLGALVVRYRSVRFFFGKVTMYTSYNMRARNMLLYFLHKYFPDADGLVIPFVPLERDMENPYYNEVFKDLEYADAYKVLVKELKNLGERIPPLINSYMNLSPSMRMFGTAVNEGFGGVEESGILLKIEDVYTDKIERHVLPLRKWRERLSIKWWREKSK